MLNKAEVRKMAKDAGKRIGADALAALEFHVREKVQALVTLHDGGRKTVKASTVHYFFGGKR